MCFSIETERAAKNYLNEVLRYPRGWNVEKCKIYLDTFQISRGWLKDYEIRDGKLLIKFVPTGEPGMAAVDKAIIEGVDRHQRLMELA